MLYKSFSKEIIPNIQSKPPLTKLEAISSHPSIPEAVSQVANGGE